MNSSSTQDNDIGIILDANEVVVSIEAQRELILVLVIIAKLKFKVKLKYYTREIDHNYYQQVEKISIIILSMFYAAIRVCNM